MKKILNILNLYLATLKGKESQETHAVISFILIRSLGVLHEKAVEFAECSRKKYMQKQQEKKVNEDEESSVIREYTDFLVKTNNYFEEKLRESRTGVIDKADFASDIDFNLAHDKIVIYLQYHKKSQMIKETNRMVKCLSLLTDEMNNQRQAAIVATEKAEQSDKLSEHMRENIHNSILRREAESRQIIAHK